MKPLTSRLVKPLEDSFQSVLDDIARTRGWPTSGSPSALGALVRRLSDAYNDATSALPRSHEALAARLQFSFPRDVPKGAGAVRELVATGALAFAEGRPLRVLDVGAGLGATSRGIARALAANGAAGQMIVDAVDSDGDALGVATAIARARPREGDVTLDVHAVRASVSEHVPSASHDVVVFGQVLSELDRDSESERVARHAALVRRYAAALRNDGSLVIVEPALRERTRHLHEVRDALLAAPGAGLHVFAPCTHDAPCPMLNAPDAWCHEDLDVDLPAWLVPVARAAGLRWQGLTFSYLVLRKDGRRQLPAARTSSALRVVSGPVVTKGKRELYLCGAFEGAETPTRLKVMRLDRHQAPVNAAWDEAARGDVVELVPSPTVARPRVEAGTRVERLTASLAGDRAIDAPEADR